MKFGDFAAPDHSRIWQEHFEWCNFAYFPDLCLLKGEYPSWGGAINADPYIAVTSGDKRFVEAIKWISENGFPKRLHTQVLRAIQETE